MVSSWKWGVSVSNAVWVLADYSSPQSPKDPLSLCGHPLGLGMLGIISSHFTPFSEAVRWLWTGEDIISLSLIDIQKSLAFEKGSPWVKGQGYTAHLSYWPMAANSVHQETLRNTGSFWLEEAEIMRFCLIVIIFNVYNILTWLKIQKDIKRWTLRNLSPTLVYTLPFPTYK